MRLCGFILGRRQASTLTQSATRYRPSTPICEEHRRRAGGAVPTFTLVDAESAVNPSRSRRELADRGDGQAWRICSTGPVCPARQRHLASRPVLRLALVRLAGAHDEAHMKLRLTSG